MLPNLSMATAGAQSARPGESPYGPLATEPDENGLLLPEGFTSRIIGVAGEPVADTDYAWHAFPDGAATFPTDDGGWLYACNSEVFTAQAADAGGVSAVRFDADGTIVDAYRILEGSNSNCAGGPTPWGTWLSGEESMDEQGRIWECDPTGEEEAVAHLAMGRFAHEGAAVDPMSKTVYLTQDHPTGLLYRFTPTAYPDLSEGLLEAAVVAGDGTVTWSEVPDPSGATTPTREQVPEATRFVGGEGIWYHEGTIYFTTKGDHSVHRIDVAEQRHEVIWKGDPAGAGVEGAVLSHVDNITADAGSGDLFVAEDGGNMELVIITPEGAVAPFARAVGHDVSEVTGPCFNPARDRLYFSSQRGPSPKTIGEIIPGAAGGEARTAGVTWEVTGPFRAIREPEPAPTTTLAKAAEGGGSGSGSGGDDDDDGSATPFVVGGVAVAAAAAAGGLVALRRRRATPARGAEAPPDA
ncbi:MAG TPA: alkaline phosphatase PhoX [Aquihabitans sp.]|nr:alkaline phosphatase PhoX [Aquihabitans sp.]